MAIEKIMPIIPNTIDRCILNARMRYTSETVMNINPKRRRKNGKFPAYKYAGNMRNTKIKFINRKITYKVDIIVTMIVDLASITLFSLGGSISLYNRTFIQQNPMSEIKRSIGVKKLKIVI